MNKIIKIILFLIYFFAITCFAQGVKNIEGTVWRGIDNGRETEIVFLKDGIAQISYHNGVSIMTNKNSKWVQTGNKIFIDTNNKFVERNATIQADMLIGTAKNIKNYEWIFSYKLIPQNAEPFNPSKELALEQNKLMVQRQNSSQQDNSQQPVALAPAYQNQSTPLTSSNTPDYKVVTEADDRQTFYDANSIIRNGNIGRVIVGTNFSKGAKFEDLDGIVYSLTTVSQFNCNEKKGKNLEGSFFSGKFASGKILRNQKIDDALTEVKIPSHLKIFEIVCKQQVVDPTIKNKDEKKVAEIVKAPEKTVSVDDKKVPDLENYYYRKTGRTDSNNVNSYQFKQVCAKTAPYVDKLNMQSTFGYSSDEKIAKLWENMGDAAFNISNVRWSDAYETCVVSVVASGTVKGDAINKKFICVVDGAKPADKGRFYISGLQYCD